MRTGLAGLAMWMMEMGIFSPAQKRVEPISCMAMHLKLWMEWGLILIARLPMMSDLGDKRVREMSLGCWVDRSKMRMKKFRERAIRNSELSRTMILRDLKESSNVPKMSIVSWSFMAFAGRENLGDYLC